MTCDRRAFVKTTLAASAALAAEAQVGAQSVGVLPGFVTQKIQTSGATINTLRGGSGPPLLLVHGYPQTHVEWHKIAPRLAQRFTVVMTDLRGYGDSSKPQDGENHVNYSKRAMALDQVEVMRSLGFERFAVVGHDRGARVTWRLAVEHPEVVTKAAVLDIVPSPYSTSDPRVRNAVLPLVLPDPACASSRDVDRQQCRVLSAVTLSSARASRRMCSRLKPLPSTCVVSMILPPSTRPARTTAPAPASTSATLPQTERER